jgi:hypothetical protein
MPHSGGFCLSYPPYGRTAPPNILRKVGEEGLVKGPVGAEDEEKEFWHGKILKRRDNIASFSAVFMRNFPRHGKGHKPKESALLSLLQCQLKDMPHALKAWHAFVDLFAVDIKGRHAVIIKLICKGLLLFLIDDAERDVLVRRLLFKQLIDVNARFSAVWAPAGNKQHYVFHTIALPFYHASFSPKAARLGAVIFRKL